MTHERDNLIRCFDGFASRRLLLGAAVATGASVSSLVSFAGKLAAAEEDQVAALILQVWPGLFPPVLKDAATPVFGRAHPGTRLLFDIGTADTMYPKLLAGRARPVISGGMIADSGVHRAISDGLLAPVLDESVPNKAKVSPKLVLPGALGVGFVQSPYGIMYNPDRVEKPQSWADLWKPEYKGRVAMRESYFAQYVGAAVAAGGEPDVEAGIRAWAPHRANIGAWVTSSAKAEDDISRGELWLGANWGAWTEQARAKGKKLAFALPKEGGIAYTGHMVSFGGFSPKATGLAQSYLNLWIDDEVQGRFVKDGFMTPTNRAVAIPQNMIGMEAVMSAEQAAAKLIPYDVKGTGERMGSIMQLVASTLK